MINKIKGTRDLNFKEAAIYELMRKTFLMHAQSYNFNLIETPILEQADLYRRSVEQSDIVQKEMYQFLDRGEREVALRPEGTAGFVRALIENKWYATLKTPKFAYYGPMFRYEQPQKGRQRQFYQAGVESVGSKNAYTDVELIALANTILKTLNVSATLKINSIGDFQSRQNYQEALKNYLLPFKDKLSKTSQDRLKKNVLRILDDKEDSKKDFVKKAPKINQYLTKESKEYFGQITYLLDSLGIKYKIDYSLVRGLDYYNDVVYEFQSNSENAGSQATIIAGGRYSNLIKELDGPDLESSGWGFGVDRIAEIIMEDNIEINNEDVEKIDVLVAATNENDLLNLFSLSNELRSYGIKIEVIKEITKSKKIFNKAEKLNADFVIFDDEKLQKNLYYAKAIKNNERISFSFDEDGFVNLLEFMSDNGLKKIEELEINEEN